MKNRGCAPLREHLLLVQTLSLITVLMMQQLIRADRVMVMGWRIWKFRHSFWAIFRCVMITCSLKRSRVVPISATLLNKLASRLSP